MNKILTLAILLCAAAALGEVKPWASPAEVDSLAQELREFLKGAEVRYPGLPGNLAMEEKISVLFADSGLQHGEIKFRAACFIPGKTSFSFSNQPPIRIYAMHPTLFRPGNFKEKEFTAPLVYLGKGSNEDLDKIRGVPLEGALALMEFDCENWMRLLRFGIKGFIFIEPETYDSNDAQTKVYGTEVAVPRFLVSRADGIVLKTNITPGAKVNVKADPSRWANKMLRDLWVLIPGSNPDLGREVAVVVAPLDSSCIVPEMAPGVQAGANLFCLKKLLAEFQHQPPARSVLLIAVNAHVLAEQGERMLAWHMLAKEDERERLRDTFNNDLRVQRALIDHYSRLRLDGYSRADEELLVSWRSLVDESTSKNIVVKNPLVALAKRDINRLKNEQLTLFQQNLPKQEAERRRKELEAKRGKYTKVLTLFNKVGVRTKLSDLSEEEILILKGYVKEVVQFNTVCAELNEQDLLLERQNDAVREALKGNKTAFMISLALNWTSPQVGFFAGRTMPWHRRWGVNTFAISKQLDSVRAGRKNLLADTLTLRGGLTADYYFFGFYSLSLLRNADQTAAFDLTNVFPAGGNAFLPSDTFENLNKINFADEVSFLLPYFRALFDAPHITSPSELDTSQINRGKPPMAAIQIKTFKFDELSASVVPELPVPNTAVILSAGGNWTMLTDQRAATVFYGLNVNKEKGKTLRATMAFHYDDDFTAVDHAIDAGDAQKKMSSDDFYTDLILTLFECREFPIFSMDDSSLVSGSSIRVGAMIPLTAKGNSSPRKYGMTGVKSVLSKKVVNSGMPAAFYFSRDEKIKLLTDKKRLALNATEKEYEGRGYASAAELGSDFFRDVVNDMSILNRARIKKLKDVTSDLMLEFAVRGDRCISEMKSAMADHDYLKYLRKLYEGLGAQAKSYEQANQASDDMLKAIVIYMALLLPFCFFIEKLIFNFVKIEQEMGMFAILFVAAFLVFRQIHPAFRVAQAAEAIFIAFVIGALGLFVISILRERFEGEMQLMFRSYLSGIMDEAAYSTVTQKAMLIGVNNMKRRRIRTMLTTMTIVLIAFAMLSFTSISKKVNPTIVHESSTPPYTGFMFSWPGKSRMDEATYEVMRDLFGAYGQVAVRRWMVMSDRRDSYPFHVYVNNGKETTVDAVLGLSKAEDGFAGKLPIVAGRYFSSDTAREALVSSQMAENLSINPAKLDEVFVDCGGYRLNVVGIYDDDRIKNLKDLNGIPILPIKGVSQNVKFSEDDVEQRLGEMGVLFFVDPLSLLIAPVDVVGRMGGGAPYSVSVKMKDAAPVWPLMDIILTSTMAKFYMGSLQPFSIGGSADKKIAPGVYYIGSNYKTSVGGLAVLLVPLFIAATIILNTMLGSVYERKKEIAVYNAIGLNPHHIGLFFLAESFVYGVIGSVGGYLIGQLLSIGVNYTGLVKGINFNYSSLSVAYVIIFTIGIVLLSTIYPALAAVRTAVPSGKRTWSMPEHKGNIMEIVFPFIYQPKIASGVLVYLKEYFANFTEISIGDLIANQLAHGCKKDEKGRECFNLEYHIALAPYDLGVTENLRFNLSYDDYVQAYCLILKIERVSGQDANWIMTNRPFLERLRKYLMRWRNLDLGQQTLYVQQSSHTIVRSS